MRGETRQAIQAGIVQRREMLSRLTPGDQRALLEELFRDFFGQQHLTLQKWAVLTGQTAQLDTGYIAQFIASIVLREPGQGFRGKGDDLADGSEVKSAANISGVDRPRWNHNLGKPSEDEQRRRSSGRPVWEEYLDSPNVFYVLVDRVVGDERPAPVRVRAWCVDARRDEAWRGLVIKWKDERSANTYNFQLHPPVGYDDSIVVNSLGNLDFSDLLLFDARLSLSTAGEHRISWYKDLASPPLVGRSRSVDYGGRGSRPTRLTDTENVVADIALVTQLFPDVAVLRGAADLAEVTTAEAGSPPED